MSLNYWCTTVLLLTLSPDTMPRAQKTRAVGPATGHPGPIVIGQEALVSLSSHCGAERRKWAPAVRVYTIKLELQS